jgi:hypothetical protein
MANFDSLLSGLHETKVGGAILAGENADLVVNAKR